MVLEIPADIEADIRERIESGRYQDAAEMMRAALRSLDARERRV